MIQGGRIQNGRITVCKAKGRLTFPEIRASVIDMSMDRMTSRVLCDLTQATVADLSTVEIEEIIRLISQQVHGRRGGRAAIVAFGGVDYGLARMFSTFCEIAGLPIQVKVFRTTEVAREWLQDSSDEP